MQEYKSSYNFQPNMFASPMGHLDLWVGCYPLLNRSLFLRFGFLLFVIFVRVQNPNMMFVTKIYYYFIRIKAKLRWKSVIFSHLKCTFVHGCSSNRKGASPEKPHPLKLPLQSHDWLRGSVRYWTYPFSSIPIGFFPISGLYRKFLPLLHTQGTFRLSLFAWMRCVFLVCRDQSSFQPVCWYSPCYPVVTSLSLQDWNHCLYLTATYPISCSYFFLQSSHLELITSVSCYPQIRFQTLISLFGRVGVRVNGPWLAWTGDWVNVAS